MLRSRTRARKIPVRAAHPIGLELDYFRFLKREVTQPIRDLTEHLFRLSDVQKPRAIADDYTFAAVWDDSFTLNGIRNLRIAYMRESSKRGVRERVLDFAKKTAVFNGRQTNRVFKSVIGIDVIRAEPWIAQKAEAWTDRNMALIQSLADTQFRQVEETISEGIHKGLRHEEIAEQILERGEVAESRARLIARDQVSKWNGELTRERQTQAGVAQYIWRTAQDDRVRPSHAEKEGKSFSWADPPEDTGHPGQDIQCRCIAEPVIEDIERIKSNLGIID